MHKFCFLLITGLFFCRNTVTAQEVLPDFTVKNNNGKISVSWQNKYSKQVKGISIQRSFDSLKSFTSITTVPDPKVLAAGFADITAPYTKMFYRLFIVFDSGVYIFTASKKPEPDANFTLTKAIKKITDENLAQNKKPVKATKAQPDKDILPENIPVSQTDTTATEILPKKEIIIYPSLLIYTAKDNNVVINLPDFEINKYVVKIFEENNKLLFELNKLTEGYLVIEKVNFLHAGWFYFEIYDEGVLLEKNKFFIPKD
jgi:hypothetical protein